MFITKVTDIAPVHEGSYLIRSIHTESLYMNMRMSVFAKYSLVSSAVKRSLNLLGTDESTFVKLSELQDTISIYQNIPSSKGRLSPTGRFRTIMDSPYLQKLTPKPMNEESVNLILWAEELFGKFNNTQRYVIERHMAMFNSTRNEAKAATLGLRYGAGTQTLHNRSKGLRGASAGQFVLDDLSSLERRVCSGFGKV